MRGRKSSRGAAVVLAGCVGLAVMAPGLALAESPGDYASQATCEAASYVWNTTAGSCAATTAGTSGSGSSRSSESSTTGSSSTSTSTSTTTTTTPTTTTTTPDAGLSGVTTPVAPEVAGGTVPADGTTSSGSIPTASADTAPVTLGARSAKTAESELQAALVEELPVDPAALIPIELPPGLPFEIPTEIPTGGFTNPQEACGFFVSQLSAATPEEAAALGAAAAGFCGSLPTSFTGLDPTDLIQDLLDIINGLIPSLPGNGGTIPTSPPPMVPAAYHGYWYHQYDVDCGDVTYDEAQAILAYDRSDPFNLDGDNDGEACEDNGHGSARYVGYPVGGVSTGDGSTGTLDASPAALALAGAGVGGLALAGLTLVRRFGREG